MGDGLWGFIGVIVGAVIAGGKEFLVDYFKHRQNARYLAIRLVCLLDRYVDGCVDVVADNGTVYGRPANEDGTHAVQAAYPEFPIDSLDVDWKSLPHDLMYEVLGFPSLIEMARQKISAEAEHAFPPDYAEAFEERQFQFARLGLRAWKAAEKLRALHKIPPRVFEGGWNPIECLQDALKRIEETRKSRAAQPLMPPI